ncbi:molybdopterin-guanine dinucleotide biosynthesis protein MobB [Dickeya fangzhongdai]|uniref:molybdopterin-guanine dinucleotide biosynthesis protein MobB n=1 Tax=Dickeya fangzhongdai TaxID=1778540 RepID=UPI000690D932|nr:molybdopterin-guanine dinucleotide biosynthesis protein MobB [Dickeya fangzhongdai]
MAPLLGIAAWSGTGKTTLLKQLIPLLSASGLRVGLIKHTHHNMEIDKPGKDSYELRKAGAIQTLAASSRRWALITETPEEREPDLMYLASRMDSSHLDLILVEGFKHEPVAKILLYRNGTGHLPDELEIDAHTLAVASDIPLLLPVLQLDLNAPHDIAKFIISWLESQKIQEREYGMLVGI